MKRILILIPRRKLEIYAALVLFLCAGVCLVLYGIYSGRAIPVMEEKNREVIDRLQKENEKLKGVFTALLPGESKTIYEDEYRNSFVNIPGYKPPIVKTYPLKDVLRMGVDIEFSTVFNQPGYLRPIYSPDWKHTFYRGWLYLPYKIVEARHKLFTYYGGLSNIYDFEGSLSFTGSASVDYHRNINYLVYHFDVHHVKKYKNQIVLIGEPKRTGAQIIAIRVGDILPKDVDNGDFLFQLSTPQGYEVDYEYGGYARSDYLKKLEQEGRDRDTFAVDAEQTQIEELIRQNKQLEEELSYYIPAKEEILLEDGCESLNESTVKRVEDSRVVRQMGVELGYTVKYENRGYKRPVYDPLWKANYRNKWCYLPQQMCLNRNLLFVIPQDGGESERLLGMLGFQQKYKSIRTNEVGLLLYNFSVSKAFRLNTQIVLCGTPSRTGAQIITFNRHSLGNSGEYMIQLATPDDCELCYTIVKN